jgi:hypothetical protein
VSACLRIGETHNGGVIGYPLKEVYEEVAFVAYHFHWSQDEVMNMAHHDRRNWVKEISAINKKMNES